MSQGDVTLEDTDTFELCPGIYKGTETLPINYRMPQLTYAADHPGEDLPAFRFAFEVTPPTNTPAPQNQEGG